MFTKNNFRMTWVKVNWKLLTLINCSYTYIKWDNFEDNYEVNATTPNVSLVRGRCEISSSNLHNIAINYTPNIDSLDIGQLPSF